MVGDNKYCVVCGKEKEEKLIPYINKICWIDCECEKLLKEKELSQKRSKAIEAYINLRTQSSYLLKREQSALFETMVIDEFNKKAIEGAKYICRVLFEDNSESKNGLILSGTRGSGKTYIAAAIINEYNRKKSFNESVIEKIMREQENGYGNNLGLCVKADCKFIKQADLINLAGRYNYKDNYLPIDEFKESKMLLIDDVGTSYGEKEKTRAIMFNILDYRYSQALSTVITTNLSSNELKDYLGERTFDRLRSCCYFVSLTAKESRRE